MDAGPQSKAVNQPVGGNRHFLGGERIDRIRLIERPRHQRLTSHHISRRMMMQRHRRLNQRL